MNIDSPGRQPVFELVDLLAERLDLLVAAAAQVALRGGHAGGGLRRIFQAVLLQLRADLEPGRITEREVHKNACLTSHQGHERRRDASLRFQAATAVGTTCCRAIKFITSKTSPLSKCH